MTCQCADHACNNPVNGEWPIKCHEGVTLELCKVCYIKGHGWRREIIPPHRRTLERVEGSGYLVTPSGAPLTRESFVPRAIIRMDTPPDDTLERV